jgi:hypothetical protein
MRLPGFLRQDPSGVPSLPEDPGSGGHAARGCIIGCLAGLFLWFVPIPVAAIAWLFDLQRPFSDVMLMAIPFYLALPIIGAGLAELLGRRRATRSCRR